MKKLIKLNLNNNPENYFYPKKRGIKGITSIKSLQELKNLTNLDISYIFDFTPIVLNSLNTSWKINSIFLIFFFSLVVHRSVKNKQQYLQRRRKIIIESGLFRSCSHFLL